MYNHAPHQIEISRVLAAQSVRSVRAVAGVWDKARPTEGAMSALVEFENGIVASLVYGGYDRFDSDEFHGWIGAGGRVKKPDHGSARRALKSAGALQESELRTRRGFAGRGTEYGQGVAHQPHFGVLIASCERAGLSTSADGIIIYGDDGPQEILLPAGRAVPNRDLVADDFYDAVVNGKPPLQDATWGLHTVEAALALVRSAKERREIFLDR